MFVNTICLRTNRQMYRKISFMWGMLRWDQFSDVLLTYYIQGQALSQLSNAPWSIWRKLLWQRHSKDHVICHTSRLYYALQKIDIRKFKAA